jgi:DNA-directed RNA polymerase
MWTAIGEVVVAAVDAMAWLQNCAGAMNRLDAPLLWTTPDGFKVWQKTLEIETTQIDTQLAGRFQVRVGSHVDKIDKHKQRSGVSPNFVHSVDATHLRMTVTRGLDAGIKDFALIHDDYGTHAANTDTLHKVLRESFVALHAEHDLLAAFADELAGYGGLAPDLPAKGSLDVRGVLESPYFFG